MISNILLYLLSIVQALHFESTGDFEEAKKLYAKELEVNPQNTAFLRRMAAVKKAQGDLVGAAEALRMLLATNQTDYASWEEAAALYLRMGAMSQGIFCLEEVLMHQPGNIAAQMLLADTLYATGGVANWKAARGYYAGLLEATGGSSVRALWGVCSCMAQLKANQGKGSSSTSPEDDDGAALAYAAAEALVQAYAEAGGGEKLELAKEVLKSQSLLSTL